MALPIGAANSIHPAMAAAFGRRQLSSHGRRIGPFAPPLDPTVEETITARPMPGSIGTPYFNPPTQNLPQDFLAQLVHDRLRKGKRNPLQELMEQMDTRMLAMPFSPMTDRGQMSQGTGGLMELIAHLGMAGGGYGRGI